MSGQVRPAAFTRDQLWRGALHAWLGFVALLVIAAGVWTLVVSAARFDLSTVSVAVYAAGWFAVLGALISLVVTIVGLPVAALIGHALRGVRRRWVHLVAFAAFGVGIGAAVVGVFVALSKAVALDPTIVTVLLALCAAATAYGRWQGARTPKRRAPAIEEEDRLLGG